jgi:hypothetical protein
LFKVFDVVGCFKRQQLQDWFRTSALLLGQFIQVFLSSHWLVQASALLLGKFIQVFLPSHWLDQNLSPFSLGSSFRYFSLLIGWIRTSAILIGQFIKVFISSH